MIAIISTNMDQSTSDVIDWLLFYQKDFIRINETDEIRGCNVNVDNKNVSVILNINGKKLNRPTASMIGAPHDIILGYAIAKSRPPVTKATTDSVNQ